MITEQSPRRSPLDESVATLALSLGTVADSVASRRLRLTSSAKPCH